MVSLEVLEITWSLYKGKWSAGASSRKVHPAPSLCLQSKSECPSPPQKKVSVPIYTLDFDILPFWEKSKSHAGTSETWAKTILIFSKIVLKCHENEKWKLQCSYGLTAAKFHIDLVLIVSLRLI